jgi:hypothetical protein
MKAKRLLNALALLALFGCAGYESLGEFTRGRQALIRGDTNDVLAIFKVSPTQNRNT